MPLIANSSVFGLGSRRLEIVVSGVLPGRAYSVVAGTPSFQSLLGFPLSDLSNPMEWLFATGA